MNKDDIVGVDVSQQIYDPLRISMRRKRHVLHSHFNFIGLVVNMHDLLFLQQFITQSALNTISRYDKCVPLISAPFLEYLHASA